MKTTLIKIKALLITIGVVCYTEHVVAQSFQYTGGTASNIDELKKVKKVDNNIYFFGNHQIGGKTYMHLFKTDMNGIPIWNKSLQDTVYETAQELVVTKSKKLIIAGSSRKFIGPSTNTSDAYIGKVDLNGNVLWEKTYSLGGFETILHRLITTSDNGFAFTGGYYDLSNNYIGYLCKTDSNGVVQWCKEYNCINSLNFNSLEQMNNGDYLLAGSASIGFQMIDAIAMRVNSSGNPIWNNYLNYDASGTQNTELIYSHELTGGDLLLSGYSDYQGSGNTDLLVIRTTGSGTVVYDKFYGSSQLEWAYGANYDINTGKLFICGDATGFGNASQNDAIVTRIDSLGTFIDMRVIGDTSASQNSEKINSIAFSSNGYIGCGFIIDPTLNVDYYYVEYPTVGAGCDNYFNVLNTVNYTGTVQNASISAVAASMTLTGRTHTISSSISTSSICLSLSTGLTEYRLNGVQLYPNPSRDRLHVHGDGSFELYNIDGQLVSEGKIENETIDLKTLTSGIYYLKLNTNVYKIIKQD